MKGSVQHCVESEIDVFRKEVFNDFKLVIYIRIGKWPNNEKRIRITVISKHYVSK